MKLIVATITIRCPDSWTDAEAEAIIADSENEILKAGEAVSNSLKEHWPELEIEVRV